MTTKELAQMLSGRQYGNEITTEEEILAKADGLVVVFAYSDDNIELRGAINAEDGCFDGGITYITEDGILECPDCNLPEFCNCPYFKKEREKARKIEAVWHDEGSPCWTYETDIPHKTFEIYEYDDLFCVGIVFGIKDI